MKSSSRVAEHTMQCPHSAHPDSIHYGTNRGVQRYRCPACRRIFQTLRPGKDPALKQQACPLYLEGMGMRAIGRVLGIHHKTVSRWLAQAAQTLPASQPQTQANSFIEIDELCTFIAKKIQRLALASGGLHLWQGPRLCLWKEDNPNRQGSLGANQAPAGDERWHGHAEGLREFYPTRHALRGQDLHHTNRITELPTQALSSPVAPENVVLQQIKTDVGSFFEIAHP